MFRLLASLALVSILGTSALLAFSWLYDSSVVHDGPAYPTIEQSKSLPIVSKPVPETKDCLTEAQRVRRSSQTYRSCSVVEDCQYMPHGYVSMLAVNKSHAPAVEKMYATLNQYCDDRQSHDAFYSQHGIEVRCTNQRCEMRDIYKEEKHQEWIRQNEEKHQEWIRQPIEGISEN
jgi:hypothetical protein